MSIASRLIFGSEVKAILADPKVSRTVDIQALGELFTYRFVPAPRTLFGGIQKIPAGHKVVIVKGDIRISRYWDSVPAHRVNASKRELIAEYQEIVKDTVRLQLRSDVPVGLFLSSGVDSGCLLALMREQLGGPVHTFTIGFVDGERTNETQDAREMAQRYGAHHHEMLVGPQDYLDYYDRYLWDLEEPVGNESAAAFYFVSKIAATEVKVALTGQGARTSLGVDTTGIWDYSSRNTTVDSRE